MTKLGMQKGHENYFSWIEENIQKHGQTFEVERALSKVQAFYKSVLNTMDETFKLSKQMTLQ